MNQEIDLLSSSAVSRQSFLHGAAKGEAVAVTAGGGGEGRDASATVTKNGKLEVVVDSSVEPKKTMLLPERRMERVPLTLRKDKKTKGYFDPKVISIGPYHHEDPDLLHIGKRIKPIIAELYVRSSTKRDMLRMKILEIVDVARSYYVEGSTDKYSDEDFAEMMLLDGLFLLPFFEELPRICNYGTQEELQRQLGVHDYYLAIGDILLVENQLPFQVLELLLSLNSGDKNLTDMWVSYWNVTMLAMSMTLKIKVKTNDERIDGKKLLHFAEFLWQQQNKFSLSSHDGVTFDRYFSFRSISELKAKGIHIRRSSVFDQRNIKFRPFFFFFGLLEISPLIVDSQFIAHLSNQIAYEWMPNNRNNQPTVAYINFLKSLINSTEDVKELRARNILLCPCSSDEEVVRMINDIPTISLEDSTIYAEVKQSIQKHYDSKAKTWIAELIHKYFSSPWTFIAFLAAIALLIMSVLQTYFTINPRK